MSNEITTIPRSHRKQIAGLSKELTECRVFSRSNDYTGAPVDPVLAWNALWDYDHARLTDHGNGKYVITLHGEHWYELRAKSNKRSADYLSIDKLREIANAPSNFPSYVLRDITLDLIGRRVEEGQ